MTLYGIDLCLIIRDPEFDLSCSNQLQSPEFSGKGIFESISIIIQTRRTFFLWRRSGIDLCAAIANSGFDPSRSSPLQGFQQSIYIKISCLCVEWRHVYRLTKLQTGTSGHKWRPGHRDIGNINDDRDTQRESDRDTRNVRLAITINKAPGHKWRPGHREYKWRPGHK